MKSIILIFFCLFLTSASVNSQKAFVHNFEITLCKGFKETIVPKNEVGSEIDLMNYMYRFPLLLEDAYTGVSVGMNLGDKLDFKYKVLFDNALNFKNSKASVSFSPKKNFGYKIGFYSYEQVLNRYFDFPFNISYGSYFLIADLKSKERFFDKTYYAGIIWNGKYKKLQIETSLNAGVCSFSQVDIDLFLKKQNSNEILKINYISMKEWDGMIFPELEAKYDLYANKRFNAGIKLSANSIIASRSLNYYKLVYVDREEFSSSILVFPKNHLYFRYEVDMGIYFKW